MSIEVLVQQAFANTRRPDGEFFATPNDEGASQVFLDARWEQVGTEQLRQHSAAVNFLAPNAFAYFLPAFILASLSDIGVRDSLLSVLLPPKADTSRPSFVAWWGRLTLAQKDAVIAFVDHCGEKGAYLDNASLEALKRQVGPNTSFERTREG